MKIKSIKVIDGKNKWSEPKDKLIHMVLDLGEFEEKPSNKIEGFYERIKEHLPSLQSHRCSEGKPGGFFKRIKEGTWMGHIIEHVALELQTLAGMDTGWGRTRGVKGQKGVYNVVFNYVDKDKGKLAAREAFNVVNNIIDNKNPQIDNIVKKLKPKTKLQESIRRILREDEYSPAGKEIIPNKIVIHKSNPKVRDKILNEGLKVRAGECYKIYAGYGEKCIPAIFATNSTNKRASFDSTYDDDVWEINTEMIPDVRWYKDKHYESRSKHIVTFENIPVDAITLKHEGTGKDWGLMESNDKFNKEKITKTFQDIINKTLSEIKNICGDEDDDTFPDWLSDDDCSVADSIDKITILNVEKRTNMDRTTFFKVDVNIGFNSIFRWIDYDDLMYRIANRIIGKWKIRLIFNIKEQDNSNKGEMWESSKHKNINESKFFHRRVDLNDVEKLLPINSRQVFYETESYEQFKYEITLRAVESIMYNEYGMGYEDLPEQEEIDFVTEVSDIFEDTIKDTYDYFNNL